MVRLWTLEAIAHGAEAVCYFRWRQAPFAQEQMHAGPLRRDSAPSAGLDEARAAADAPHELPAAADAGRAREEKNWGEADRLGDAIAAAGFQILDGPEGSQLRPR